MVLDLLFPWIWKSLTGGSGSAFPFLEVPPSREEKQSSDLHSSARGCERQMGCIRLYPSGSPRLMGKVHSLTSSNSAMQVLFHCAQEESEVGKLTYIGQEKNLMSDLRDDPYLSVCVACPGFCQGSMEEAGLRLGEGHTWAVTKEGGRTVLDGCRLGNRLLLLYRSCSTECERP